MDGFRGPRKGRSELMVFSEKKLYSLGRRCVYIFNRRKAKKEIPAQMLCRSHRLRRIGSYPPTGAILPLIGFSQPDFGIPILVALTRESQEKAGSSIGSLPRRGIAVHVEGVEASGEQHMVGKPWRGRGSHLAVDILRSVEGTTETLFSLKEARIFATLPVGNPTARVASSTTTASKPSDTAPSADQPTQ